MRKSDYPQYYGTSRSNTYKSKGVRRFIDVVRMVKDHYDVSRLSNFRGHVTYWLNVW